MAPLITWHRTTGELRLQPDRLPHRLLARVLSPSLDDRLARGVAPESSGLLASRARQLVAPSFRSELARDLGRVHHPSRRRSATVGRRLSPDRDAVAGAEAELRRTEAALSAPYPVGARGVAMVNLLLTDGTGPLYRRGAPVGLARALDHALDHLDPDGSLVAPS